MMLPDSIVLTHAELQTRLALIQPGYTPEQVAETLGGAPFQAEEQEDLSRRFWRFWLEDPLWPADPTEIYLGEFVDGKLVFGAIIPRG
jgi:hypothetical protein